MQRVVTPSLEKRGKGEFRLSKLRGQHFLADRRVVEKIIAAAELKSSDLVLEVGPGLGVMTREILPRVERLTAVELDPLFVRELRADFGDAPRLRLVEGDILQLRIADLADSASPYKVVTNLPYNITSSFLKKFLIEPPSPERIVVMLQKEVAENIINKPSGLLGIMCNLYAACSLVGKVPASAFTPPPKVDSTVICLKPYSNESFADKWGIDRNFAEDVIAFAAGFFAQPRKKMCGRLGKALAEKCKASLAAIGESPDSRPASLSLEKWVELWKKMR